MGGLPPVPPRGPVRAGGCGVRTIRLAGPAWRVASASPSPGPRSGRRRGGRASCARAWSASGARRGGVRWGPAAAVRAAGSARPATGAARSRSVCRARWCHTPSTPGARLPPSPMAHRMVRSPAARVVPTWVAAVGHREAWVPASGPQQPNKGLQETANSLRSCLATALGGA